MAKIGAPVRLLEKDEAVQKLGSNAYRGALLDQRAGTIQPLSYAFGLANAALKEGAELYSNSPVTGFEKTSSGYTLKTPNGRLKTKKVIIAVMGYPERASGNQINNLILFNYFQFATAPIPKSILKTVLPGKNGIWDTNLILSSFRLDKNGRLSVGSVGSLEGFSMDVNRAWAKRTLNKVFPQIGDIELESAWYGRIAINTNHIPRFHVLDDHMAMVTCYNGRGIGPGTVFGKLLAKYMSGGSPADIPLPVSPVKAVNLRALRGLFYEAGSRLYHFTQCRTSIF